MLLKDWIKGPGDKRAVKLAGIEVTMTFKKILFPVDFSPASRLLDSEVAWIANRFQSEVTLLHVFEIPVTWYGSPEVGAITPQCFQTIAEEARLRVQDYQLDVPEERVKRVVLEGDVSQIIGDWVTAHDTDLVVMGTHGYGSFKRVLLGSVAMKALHHLPCPVWTHAASASEHRFAGSVGNILCPLELNDEAVPLLRYAAGLAAEFGAKVHILHTVPLLLSRPYRYLDADLHEFLRQCAASDIAKFQHEAGTEFPVTIQDGLIAECVASKAQELHADLILMGRGRTMETLGTLRTHSYEIIRHAPCPVISVSHAATGLERTAAREVAAAV